MIFIPKIPLDKTEQKYFICFILIIFCFFFFSICISAGKIIGYEKTDATVIKDDIITSVRGGSIEHVTVSYTCNGHKYHATIKFPVPKHLETGQMLEIYYNPQNPDMISTLPELFRIPVILLIIDIFLLVVYLFGSEKI